MPWYMTNDARRDAARQKAERDRLPTPRCSVLCAPGEPCSITDKEECAVKDLTCTMELFEYEDLSDGWICSNCDTSFRATKRKEKEAEKHGCPNCGARVIEWQEADDT